MSLRKGLVGHWTMDSSETSGGTMFDSSAQDNHANLNSVNTGSSGIIGESFDFSGSNLDTGLNLEQDQISISAWFNADDITDRRAIWNIASNKSDGIGLVVESSKIEMYDDTAGNDNFKLSTSTTVGEWVHTLVTLNSSTIELYVNANSSRTASLDSINTAPFSIGSRFAGNTSTLTFDGRIDDVRLYNKILSESEVSALYNMRSQRQQNLTANVRYNSISIGDPNSKSEMDAFFDTSRSDVSNLFTTNHDRTSINHAFEGQSTSEFGSANSPPYYMQQRPEDKYSWKLEGEWTAPETGTYTFAIDSDDASDVLIDDTAVTTFYGAHSVSGSVDNNSGTINLNAGERYRIAFRYEEGGGGSGFVVGYKKPSNSSYVLFPADEVF